MKYLLFISLGLYTISCTQTLAKEKISRDTLTDKSIVAIIPYNPTEVWVFENGKSTELTTIEMDKIERLLEAYIREYNVPQLKRYNQWNEAFPKEHYKKEKFIIDLKRYKRQYVAIINAKGEKEVWINCFCSNPKYWEKYIVEVLDGGNCYFNLKINLTKDTYYDLIVN
ncbi:hypothetical protein [Emticicia fontis]